MSELEPIEGFPDFVNCYGCGAQNQRGLGLSFRTDRVRGRVEASWTPAAQLAGYRSMLHGGVIAALLDEGMGWALWAFERRVGVTRELRVSYRRPVFVEREHRIHGWVERCEETTGWLAACVRDQRDRLLAEASGEFALVSQRKARDGGAGPSAGRRSAGRSRTERGG